MICHHPSIKISQISLPQTAPINCSTFSSEATVVNILKATWPVFSNAHQYILRDCFIPPLLLVMGLRQVRLAPLAMHVGAWMYGGGGYMISLEGTILLYVKIAWVTHQKIKN